MNKAKAPARFRTIHGRPASAQQDSIGSWRINQVHPVDCLTALRSIPDNSFDLVVTSPPPTGDNEAMPDWEANETPGTT